MLFGEQSTPASDIYSLGVVLHECLAKKRRRYAAKVTVASTSITVSGHGTFTAIRYPDAPR